MKQIDFHFKVQNRTLYTCKLIKKVRSLGLTVSVWSTDEILLRRCYDDLWRFEDLTVIPHAWAGSEYEDRAGVVFSSNIAAFKKSDVIVLLDEEVPADWQKALEPFDRVVDIVSTNEREVANARNRYRAYAATGIKPNAYDRSVS